MKYINFLFVIALVIFSSCEGPIYHKYEVVNNTDKPIQLNISLSTNSDSVFIVNIDVDSSKVIIESDEMQGFFSGKIPPHNSSEVFSKFEVIKDSMPAITNFKSDSLWVLTYKPGTYTYRLQIISTDF